jgi:hypothetical protein
MSFVVRKIEYTKWRQRRILDGETPSADAITNCMRTTGNKLSLWSIADEGELEEAVIAIAAQGDHLDAIDVLTIDKSLIEERKLSLVKSRGLTPYTSFEDKHYDVVELDYNSLGLMASVIVESIRRSIEKKRNLRFTIATLRDILTNAVSAGKVQFATLKPGVQKWISPEGHGIRSGILTTPS